MEPTHQWICDTCGEIIESPEDGWVEWIRLKDQRARDLRIVHHSKNPIEYRLGMTCQFNKDVEWSSDKGTICDLPLTEFCGANGLMRLLAKIAEGCLPIMEILEIIKRIHIPGYEFARFHFADAAFHGEYEPNTYPGFPHVYQIENVLNFIREQKTRNDL